ncbi:universal stress protein [Natronorubrum sp. DTA7]|uniref:universal stress protein n=1 Tax=Natronorubrum sp. DTA7 TaxID=3447016 RepID=UPI003F836287
MHYLVGTASVHTTAAICDYLDERATSDDDATVVAVAPSDDATVRRDAQEALNVAPVRLAALDDVGTELRTGDDPARTLLETATAVDADEILIAAHDGLADESTSVGSTARQLLEMASLPVVVVPVPDA